MDIRFTGEELAFLKEEFGLDASETAQLTEDELLEIADQCFDIELEGDLQDGGRVSDRCGIAAEIVTKVNSLF